MSEVYAAAPMCDGQPSIAVDLADVAGDGRLAIYTGAGLSRAEPTNMPDGAEVAQHCYDRLVDLLGTEQLAGADPSNLVSCS